MKLTVLLVTLVTLLAIMPAMSYDWVVSPVNGHLYTLVDCISWTDAENQAVALGGHLATVRNQAENDWIFQLAFDNKATCYRLWLGLTKPLDDPGSAPAYGWSWISDEPVVYTKWADYIDPAENPVGGRNLCGYIFVRYWGNPTSYEQLTSWARNYDDDNAFIMTTGIVEVVPIPEPSSLLALVGSTTTLALLRRRKR